MLELLTKPDANDMGCWIDGHWGQYGVARMVDIADGYGFGDPASPLSTHETIVISHLARWHMAAMMPSSSLELNEEQWEWLMDAADMVEQWLNENVAPEGFSFGWHDGEFFLWSTESWEENGF